MSVCPCHGLPVATDRGCRVKKRERQRRYWTVKGWARRREREIDRQQRELTQEAED